MATNGFFDWPVYHSILNVLYPQTILNAVAHSKLDFEANLTPKEQFFTENIFLLSKNNLNLVIFP